VKEVKEELLKLKEELSNLPPSFQDCLGFPVVNEKSYSKKDLLTNTKGDFQPYSLDEFALKYLSKFIYFSNLDSVRIFGPFMPVREIKENTIIFLNLREQELFSEDLFIISQFLKKNNSITNINISRYYLLKKLFFRNYIGYKQKEEKNFLLKKEKYDEADLHSSLGLSHFGFALSKCLNTGLLSLDLSENHITSNQTHFIIQIIEANKDLRSLNLSNTQVTSLIFNSSTFIISFFLN